LPRPFKSTVSLTLENCPQKQKTGFPIIRNPVFFELDFTAGLTVKIFKARVGGLR
jgi:hypothetical protein